MKTVILDTNVLVSAYRSQRGASFTLFSLIGTGKFEVALSVPLVFEYEYALHRTARRTGLDAYVVDDILDYLCSVARHQDVWYLWRPTLTDSHDDMVLEAAMAAEADAIITYNKRDFRRADSFEIEVLTPKEFLNAEGFL